MSKALQAVQADATADPKGVLVPLVTDDGEFEILVPPPAEWFEGSVEALVAQRVTDWVVLALEPAELAKWQGIRKRNRHINQFFLDWQRLSGEDSGKSTASKAS